MRLALTDEDRSVREWFRVTAEDLGCTVTIDEMGNMFATLAGECTTVAPIAIGSHLDTQPAGGRFDGILGVLSGLEILRCIKETNVKLFAGLTVINWTNEEGARFSPGCTGAAVWSGHTPLKSALDRASSCATTTLGHELNKISYAGKLACDSRKNPISAHLELHIEQGSRLEDASCSIGVVNEIQGIRWFRVRVTGKRAHSGSTPLAERADALVAASKIVVLVEELCIKYGAFGTVGTMNVPNASPNVISGETNFSIDLRHPREATLSEMEDRIRHEMAILSTAKEERLSFQMNRIWHSPAQAFDPLLLEYIAQSAAARCGHDRYQSLRSHAGHDSALVALAEVPVAMIFVPSKGGISHAPEEWTDKQDCIIGADVLYNTVLKYDEYMRCCSQHQTGERLGTRKMLESFL